MIALQHRSLTSSNACMSCTIFLPADVESSKLSDPICFDMSVNQACRLSVLINDYIYSLT